MAGKAGSPESESLKSVLRQTSQADDLQLTEIEAQKDGGPRLDVGRTEVER